MRRRTQTGLQHKRLNQFSNSTSWHDVL